MSNLKCCYAALAAAHCVAAKECDATILNKATEAGIKTCIYLFVQTNK